MTTAHTPRTALNALILENQLVDNAAPTTCTASSTSSQAQVVSGLTAANLTWQNALLVQPTTPGYYLVNFNANVDFTSSASGSGLNYLITVNGTNATLPFDVNSNATTGTQAFTVSTCCLVSSPNSAPVFQVAVANFKSGDSASWGTRQLNWIKLAF